MITKRAASHRWPESLRWGICFALALFFHAAGAASLMARWNDRLDLVANAPVITIELAPVAAAPNNTPNELPPDTQPSKQAEPEPQSEKPIEMIELAPAPSPEAALPPPSKVVEKPKEKKPKEKQASLASAPSTAALRAERAAAPAPGANARDSDALPSWKSQLVSRLERYKRYPADGGGDHGVAKLAFSVDRSGGVHNAHIVGSSGSSALDRETLSLVERAQPMPPPPAEIAGAQISIVVPIRYNIH